MKLFINEIEYNLADGTQITELSNEELNSGILKIPHSQKLNAELLDKIKIIVSENDSEHTFYYLAGTMSEEQIKFSEVESERRYNYLINLLSPTIILENYICPNRTITQYVDKPKKSVYYYLDSYLKTYAPNLSISDELETLTENVDALEEQFPNLNLREIFNKLLEPLGCVVSMKNFTTISYIDLNAKGNAIDVSKIKVLRTEKKFEEYASHLKVNAENVIANNIDCFENNIVPKSNTGIVSDENAEIILKNPIYLIDRIYAYVEFNGILVLQDYTNPADLDLYEFEFNNEIVKLDITDFVIENSVYQSKLVGGSDPNPSWLTDFKFDFDKIMSYKINFLNYSQNSNTISGLTYNEKVLFFSKYAYENVPLAALIRDILKVNNTGKDLRLYSSTLQVSSNVRDILFDIEYKTTNSLNLEFEKENEYKNVRKFVDNQQSSYLNADRFGKSEQEKVNRIGNPELSIGGRFKGLSSVPKLNDYIDNYTLIQRTLVLYNSEILMQGYLSKDFVRKNVVQSLNQQIRFTQIDTTNNAVLRNENTVLEYEISTKPNSTYHEQMYNLINYLNNNLGKTNKNLVYVYKTRDKNGIEYGLFNTVPSVKKINNSIVINFQAKTNFAFDFRVNDVNQTGGYGLRQEPYVDEDAEFVNSEFWISEKELIDAKDNNLLALEEGRYYPLINVTTLGDRIYRKIFTRYKDNREIIGETIQIDFKTADNVYVYDAFFEYSKFLNISEQNEAIKIYLSSVSTYNKNSSSASGIAANVSLTFEDNKINIGEISVDGSVLNLTDFKSFALTLNGKLLIAVNNLFENINIIYYNVIKF